MLEQETSSGVTRKEQASEKSGDSPGHFVVTKQARLLPDTHTRLLFFLIPFLPFHSLFLGHGKYILFFLNFSLNRATRFFSQGWRGLGRLESRVPAQGIRKDARGTSLFWPACQSAGSPVLWGQVQPSTKSQAFEMSLLCNLVSPTPPGCQHGSVACPCILTGHPVPPACPRHTSPVLTRGVPQIKSKLANSAIAIS